MHRLQRERGEPVHPEGVDARFDGRPWPKTVEEITALLTAQDADQFVRTGGEFVSRTDVYALGVLLYELLTGTTPFP